MEGKDCISKKEHEKLVASVKEGLLREETVYEMADIFRMLGEPSRLKIVLALMQGECCVYHLVEAVGGTQSGVSHQLRVLKDNKIVKSRRAGQSVFYSIADAHIVQMIEVAITHTDCK
jgi:ArsR family transcriptional regulator